ncbi:hypothetical protein ACB092_02G240300 [Castanea dentata]
MSVANTYSLVLFCSSICWADIGKHQKLMAIASEFEVWWSVEESLLHVYKTPIWKIGDLICCNNRMSSLRSDLDTKALFIGVLATLHKSFIHSSKSFTSGKSRQKPQERMKVLCEYQLHSS